MGQLKWDLAEIREQSKAKTRHNTPDMRPLHAKLYKDVIGCIQLS